MKRLTFCHPKLFVPLHESSNFVCPPCNPSIIKIPYRPRLLFTNIDSLCYSYDVGVINILFTHKKRIALLFSFLFGDIYIYMVWVYIGWCVYGGPHYLAAWGGLRFWWGHNFSSSKRGHNFFSIHKGGQHLFGGQIG